MKFSIIKTVGVSITSFFLVYLSLYSNAYAGMVSSLVSKVKTSLFVSADETTEKEMSSRSTMLTPALADASFDTQDTQNDTLLEVKIGAMRLSTEDIDYPLEDTITTYEVKDGDTVASVAKLFDVTVNTILWANDIPTSGLKKGDTIIVLPVTGIKYRAKTGDSLTSIAKKFKGEAAEIARYNGIAESSNLSLGQEIIIPDGEVEAVKPKQIAKSSSLGSKIARKLTTAPLGFFVKPLLSFIKTQGIHGKNGVDLAAKIGSPIVATASGKVIVAKADGYNGGYGKMIVIAHKNNIQTLYGHLSALSVKQGDVVEQGQVIGALGNTGRSTGPHLHIEVRGAANPF